MIFNEWQRLADAPLLSLLYIFCPYCLTGLFSLSPFIPTHSKEKKHQIPFLLGKYLYCKFSYWLALTGVQLHSSKAKVRIDALSYIVVCCKCLAIYITPCVCPWGRCSLTWVSQSRAFLSLILMLWGAAGIFTRPWLSISRYLLISCSLDAYPVIVSVLSVGSNIIPCIISQYWRVQIYVYICYFWFKSKLATVFIDFFFMLPFISVFSRGLRSRFFFVYQWILLRVLSIFNLHIIDRQLRVFYPFILIYRDGSNKYEVILWLCNGLWEW